MPPLAPAPPRLSRVNLAPREREADLAEGRRLLEQAARKTRSLTAFKARADAPQAARLKTLERLRLDAQRRTRGLTERLLRGDLSRDAWQRQMRAALVPAHYAAALAGTGSVRLDERSLRDVQAQIRTQLGYLGRFRRDIATGPMDGRILARADLYGAAVWSTGQAARAGQAAREGHTEELGVLGVSDHCESCVDRASRGWVAIGTLLPIGAGICRSRCACHLEFRRPSLKRAEAIALPAGQVSELTEAGRKRIEKAVAYARSKGIDVEPNAASDIEASKGAKAFNVPGMYHAGTKKIYINERSPYWNDPSTIMDAAGKTKWLSTDRPAHVIVHEVGHAEHHRAVGTESYNRTRTAAFTTEEKAIASRVSRYAATKPIELVPEVYSGLVAGKTYDPAVLQLYRSLGGPDVSAPAAAAGRTPGPPAGVNLARAQAVEVAPRNGERRRTTSAKLAVADGAATGVKDLDIAIASERVIVEAIGGKHTGDSHPVDVEIRRKSGRIDGLEIKTVLKKSDPRISVHPDALLRKVDYVQADPNRVVHTIVNDQRDAFEGGKYAHLYSGSTLRYRRGAGRYAINDMHPVRSFAELRSLIEAPDHELPAAARGVFPGSPEALEKLRAEAAIADAGRKRRDDARRERRNVAKKG